MKNDLLIAVAATVVLTLTACDKDVKLLPYEHWTSPEQAKEYYSLNCGDPEVDDTKFENDPNCSVVNQIAVEGIDGGREEYQRQLKIHYK